MSDIKETEEVIRGLEETLENMAHSMEHFSYKIGEYEEKLLKANIRYEGISRLIQELKKQA